MAAELPPLHRAAMEDELGQVEALLVRGADPNERIAGNTTALMLAAENGFIEHMETLVQYGADPNAADDRGVTALMRLGELGAHSLCVEALLQCGAAVGIEDDCGRNVFSYARRAPAHEDLNGVLQVLLRYTWAQQSRGGSVATTPGLEDQVEGRGWSSR